MASNNAEAEAFMDVFSGHLDLARRSLAGLPEHRLTSLADAARELMELAETIRDENDAVTTDWVRDQMAQMRAAGVEFYVRKGDDRGDG